MRLPILLLGLALTVGACSLGGGDTRSAVATERAADDVVRDVITSAAEAVGGTQVEAEARWRVCSGGVGHQYQGGGRFVARDEDAAQQLEDIRSALTDSGFTDISQVQGQVAVEHDEITVVVQPPIAPREWRVAFRSECHTYSGEDEERVGSGEPRRIDGLV